jgi:UDP:flavonoid glycosyltransferase YjiC (YdhE family)
MTTNGGFNGVQLALSHGVPLIAAGQTEDKPEVCTRIEWSGVGINLKTQLPKPAQIQQAVQKILNEPHYKERAKVLQSEIQQLLAEERAIALLEELASTQQPVLRKT